MGDIGRLTRRIKFEQLTTIPDDYGGNTEVYVTKSIVWGSRKQLSSSKAVAFGIDLLSKAFEYEFRKDAFNPTKLNRVDDGGVKMNIVSIEEIGDGKKYLRITAKEKE